MIFAFNRLKLTLQIYSLHIKGAVQCGCRMLCIDRNFLTLSSFHFPNAGNHDTNTCQYWSVCFTDFERCWIDGVITGNFVFIFEGTSVPRIFINSWSAAFNLSPPYELKLSKFHTSWPGPNDPRKSKYYFPSQRPVKRNLLNRRNTNIYRRSAIAWLMFE